MHLPLCLRQNLKDGKALLLHTGFQRGFFQHGTNRCHGSVVMMLLAMMMLVMVIPAMMVRCMLRHRNHMASREFHIHVNCLNAIPGHRIHMQYVLILHGQFPEFLF